MRPPDFIAKLQYLSAEQGGRNTAAISGYRPHVKFPFSTHLTSGQQIFLDKETVLPGESVLAEITLLVPEPFEHLLFHGIAFEFSEGTHLIGIGIITEIINEKLRRK